MIPYYDITFQANAKNHNRRRAMWSDSIPIHDFNQLIDDFGPNGVIKKGNAYEERDIPIHLLAGISYRKRFIELAKNLCNEIILRYCGPSVYLRDRQRGLKLSICEYAPGRRVYQYTWVYQCAQEEYLNYRK